MSVRFDRANCCHLRRVVLVPGVAPAPPACPPPTEFTAPEGCTPGTTATVRFVGRNGITVLSVSATFGQPGPVPCDPSLPNCGVVGPGLPGPTTAVAADVGPDTVVTVTFGGGLPLAATVCLTLELGGPCPGTARFCFETAC